MHDKPVALITPANQGIGLQIAKDLAEQGFTVLVGSRNKLRGTRTVQQAAREPVRLVLLDAHGPTGTFSNEDGPLPW